MSTLNTFSTFGSSDLSSASVVNSTNITSTSVTSTRTRFVNTLSATSATVIGSTSGCSCGASSGSCNCVVNTGPLVPTGIAIIGDSAGAILLANLLLAKIDTDITVINTGPDILTGNVNYVQQISYPALASVGSQILTSLKTVTINVVKNNDANNVILTYQYNYPVGLMGDLIQSYKTPRLGPWFPLQTIGTQNLTRFFRNNLTILPLNPTEQTIANLMSSTFTIPIIRSVFTKTPAILGQNISLLVPPIGGNEPYVRNLFTDAVFNFPGRIVNNATNIQIGYVGTVSGTNTNGRPRNIYNLCGNGFSLTNVELFWKTDPYEFLKLSSTSNNSCVNPCGNFNSGAFNGILYLPTSLRARLPIDIVNQNGITFPSADQANGDGVIAELTFGLSQSKSTNDITWLCNASIVVEDFYPVQRGGVYPPAGKYFLIVEAIAGNNTRKTQWNPLTNSIEVSLNDQRREYNTILRFADIVAAIYNTLVGSTVYNASNLLNIIQTCSPTSCSDTTLIEDLPTRPNTIALILSLINAVFPTNAGILSLFPTGG